MGLVLTIVAAATLGRKRGIRKVKSKWVTGRTREGKGRKGGDRERGGEKKGKEGRG